MAMNWEKFEKFSKVMEKWHNRIYRFVCVGIVVIITNITGIGIIGWANYRTQSIIPPDLENIMWNYDIIIFIGTPVIYIFLAYTILFTQFRFPIQFKGDGTGRKIIPPNTRR